MSRIAHDGRRTKSYVYQCTHCQKVLGLDTPNTSDIQWYDPVVPTPGRVYTREHCDMEEFMMQHYNLKHYKPRRGDEKYYSRWMNMSEHFRKINIK